MSKRISPTIVGTFFLGALALAIAAIALFGSGALFADRRNYVLYFEGSVAGLQLGSPVTYRGVRVGSVTDIRLILDADALVALIPVYIQLEPERIELSAGRADDRVMMPALIEKGLRGQLVSTSFVTGQLAVDLQFHPGTPAKLVGAERTRIEIPTVPSRMAELTRKLEQLPLEELISSGVDALQGIKTLVERPELASAIGDAGQMMVELKTVISRIGPDVAAAAGDMRIAMAEIASAAGKADQQIVPLSQEAQGALRQVRESVTKLEVALNSTLARAGPMLTEIAQAADSVEKLTTPQSRLIVELLATLREFQTGARSIKTLADTLDRNPEALLRGKPGGR
jgi:paraquat-inducible protein B